MSGLVPNTRVSWALVVVVKDGVKSLHLLKKNYRGQLTYFSKTARGVPDKIGFGEVSLLGLTISNLNSLLGGVL